MKSPFHLLLSHHRNDHDPERTPTTRARTNRASNKIKTLSTGGRGGGGSGAGRGGDSQSSSTTRSGARRREGSMSGKSRSQQQYSNDRQGGRDRHHHSGHHSGHQPKSFRNPRPTNNDMVWSANQSVNSLQQDTASHAQSTECSTATGKGRSSSSRRMVDRRVQGRNDELAATCLAVGATVDTCMNEETGYLLADAIAAYACGYDEDDDDDDFDDEDDMYEQRDDSSAVYQTIYQFVQGIAGSKKQTPPHSSYPVKDVPQQPPGTMQKVPAQDEAKQVPRQVAPPQEVAQAEIRLRTATPDVRDDVVSLPDDIHHRQVIPMEDNTVAKRQESTDRNSQPVASHTIKDSDDGRDASDDSMGGTSTHTSSHTSTHDQQQQSIALNYGERNFFQYLFQALSHVTCQEPEWPLDHPSLPSDAIPANGTNSPEHNESSREASVPTTQSKKLEDEVPSSTMAPTGKPDKREMKAIFPRRGRFGRGGGRTKQDKNNVEPKTPPLQVPCEMVNNSFEQNSILVHLEPRKIKRASSAIVTTLVTTIEESASC